MNACVLVLLIHTEHSKNSSADKFECICCGDEFEDCGDMKFEAMCCEDPTRSEFGKSKDVEFGKSQDSESGKSQIQR